MEPAKEVSVSAEVEQLAYEQLKEVEQYGEWGQIYFQVGLSASSTTQTSGRHEQAHGRIMNASVEPRAINRAKTGRGQSEGSIVLSRPGKEVETADRSGALASKE